MYSKIKNAYYKETFVVYEPDIWNNNQILRDSHNCYSYMLNDINNDLINIYKNEDKEDRKILNPQPGHYCGMTKIVNYKETTCEGLIDRVLCDNPNVKYMGKDNNFVCEKNYYKGALAVEKEHQYHFYRQDNYMYWSHKDGGGYATNLDDSKNIIIDPKESNRGKYDDFCGYFCIPENYFQDTNMARNSYRDDKLWYKS